MPYNSQSRFIVELNKVFCRPAGLPQHFLAAGHALSERASWNIPGGLNTFEIAHINAWPQDQQDLLRGQLLCIIQHDLPTSFAWEEAPPDVWRTIVIAWPTGVQDPIKVGITFRSPFYTA